jgi:hypothetical protein
MAKVERWKCEECGHVCTEYLTAPHPFYKPETGETVCGCPHCFSVDKLVGACFVEDCNEAGSVGMFHDDGEYHYSCFNHSPLFSDFKRKNERKLN